MDIPSKRCCSFFVVGVFFFGVADFFFAKRLFFATVREVSGELRESPWA